jgi:hypothetical protein
VVDQLNQDDLWHPFEKKSDQDSSSLFLYQPDLLHDLWHLFFCCCGIQDKNRHKVSEFFELIIHQYHPHMEASVQVLIHHSCDAHHKLLCHARWGVFGCY